MKQELAGAIMIAVAVIVLALMLWGWSRRCKRDAEIAVPLGEPVGAVTFAADGFYVATTKHDDPLNRIATSPLAFRSRADIVVTEAGFGLSLPGEQPIFVAANNIVGADRATWTIDRVVERDGLVLVAWSDGNQILDSYVRLQDDDPAALVAALNGVRPAHSPMGAHS